MTKSTDETMNEVMAENATAEPKTTARKTASRRKAKPAVEPAAEPAAELAAAKPIAVKKRELRPDEYVTIRSGFDGKLILKSTRTGEKFIFAGFGDEHDIELQDLRKMKNTAKGLFENNWILIDDPDVIEYLGVGEYYRNALKYDEFDDIAKMSAAEIAERMKLVSAGQKETIAHHARRMVADGRIDSMKAIAALEEGLGVQLIEH